MASIKVKTTTMKHAAKNKAKKKLVLRKKRK